MNGALLVNKPKEVTSFGVIEILQRNLMNQLGLRKKDLPKLGHGGTLDPFATGLLIILVGKAVKLARYFLGAKKGYEGEIRFGETTIPGDPTETISERSEWIPDSLSSLQDIAHRLTLQPYLQTPPMHSAKKKNGKPLYELARAGIEIEREPKLCRLYSFEIHEYLAPTARFSVECSSGTYIRTLAQDLGKLMNSVALLQSLHRFSSGVFHVDRAFTLDQLEGEATQGRKWNELNCWIPFDQLLQGYDRVQATPEESEALFRGQQAVLPPILKRTRPSPQKSSDKENCVAIYSADSLIAIARKEQEVWGLERVFT